MFKIISILVLSMSLSSCANVAAWFGSPTGTAVIADVVQIAIAVAESKGVPATLINAIAQDGLEADNGVGTTVDKIGALLDAKIASLKAMHGYTSAADILIAALEGAIASKLEGNKTLANIQVAAADVFKSVIAATGNSPNITPV